MTRIFYEDGKREDEQPPVHHDPPLTGIESVFTPGEIVALIEDAGCGDCGWTFEGEWEPCEVHRDG